MSCRSFDCVNLITTRLVKRPNEIVILDNQTHHHPMAKAPAKTSVKATAAKKAAPKKVATKKASAPTSSSSIEKTSEEILKKLKSLNLDQQLQADLEWCLGSYKYDKNPIGLIESAERALIIFKEALAKKTKGVTAKMISDIESVLK